MHRFSFLNVALCLVANPTSIYLENKIFKCISFADIRRIYFSRMQILFVTPARLHFHDTFLSIYFPAYIYSM